MWGAKVPIARKLSRTTRKISQARTFHFRPGRLANRHSFSINIKFIPNNRHIQQVIFALSIYLFLLYFFFIHFLM